MEGRDWREKLRWMRHFCYTNLLWLPLPHTEHLGWFWSRTACCRCHMIHACCMFIVHCSSYVHWFIRAPSQDQHWKVPAEMHSALRVVILPWSNSQQTIPGHSFKLTHGKELSHMVGLWSYWVGGFEGIWGAANIHVGAWGAAAPFHTCVVCVMSCMSLFLPSQGTMVTTNLAVQGPRRVEASPPTHSIQAFSVEWTV